LQESGQRRGRSSKRRAACQTGPVTRAGTLRVGADDVERRPDALSTLHALRHEAIFGCTVKRLAFRTHRFASTGVPLALLHETHLSSAVKRLAVRGLTCSWTQTTRSGRPSCRLPFPEDLKNVVLAGASQLPSTNWRCRGKRLDGRPVRKRGYLLDGP
jgi:hypothetical protein